MTDAGGDAEQDGDAPAFRDLDGQQGEVVGLLRIGGFQHGESGRDGAAAVILLVLGGGHVWIVGGDDDEGAADAGVGDGEERIGRHIQAHMHHGDEGASAERVEGFENLDGGRAGVTRAEGEVGVAGGESHCFIPTEDAPERCEWIGQDELASSKEE